MDNRKRVSSTPRTDTVSTGDRGAKGLVFWLIAALILVVAASQVGPLRRYLTVPPLSARRLPAAAPADTATLSAPVAPVAPTVPAVAEPLPPLPAPQIAPTPAAPEQMPTLMLKEPPSAGQASAPALPEGEAGLVEAMRKGLLRPASGSDLSVWKSRWSQANGRSVPRTFDERTQMMTAYVIQRDFDIPAGLSGAHSVVFVLERGVPYPRGDAGHSVILDQATGACMGAVCGMLLRED
jgi:hypothetical protein